MTAQPLAPVIPSSGVLPSRQRSRLAARRLPLASPVPVPSMPEDGVYGIARIDSSSRICERNTRPPRPPPRDTAAAESKRAVAETALDAERTERRALTAALAQARTRNRTPATPERDKQPREAQLRPA